MNMLKSLGIGILITFGLNAQIGDLVQALQTLSVAQKRHGLPHLRWKANGCWFNTTMQLLANIPPLVDFLLEPQNKNIFVGKKGFKEIQQLFSAIRSNQDESYDFDAEIEPAHQVVATTEVAGTYTLGKKVEKFEYNHFGNVAATLRWFITGDQAKVIGPWHQKLVELFGRKGADNKIVLIEKIAADRLALQRSIFEQLDESTPLETPPFLLFDTAAAFEAPDMLYAKNFNHSPAEVRRDWGFIVPMYFNMHAVLHGPGCGHKPVWYELIGMSVNQSPFEYNGVTKKYSYRDLHDFSAIKDQYNASHQWYMANDSENYWGPWAHETVYPVVADFNAVWPRYDDSYIYYPTTLVYKRLSDKETNALKDELKEWM